MNNLERNSSSIIKKKLLLDVEEHTHNPSSTGKLSQENRDEFKVGLDCVWRGGGRERERAPE